MGGVAGFRKLCSKQCCLGGTEGAVRPGSLQVNGSLTQGSSLRCLWGGLVMPWVAFSPLQTLLRTRAGEKGSHAMEGGGRAAEGHAGCVQWGFQ